MKILRLLCLQCNQYSTIQYKMKKSLDSPKFCWPEAGLEKHLAENMYYFSQKRENGKEGRTKSPHGRA